MTPEGYRVFAGTHLDKLIFQLDRQIEEVRALAQEWTPPIAPEKLRDRSGQYMLTPLLVAKAQALHAMAMVATS